MSLNFFHKTLSVISFSFLLSACSSSHIKKIECNYGKRYGESISATVFSYIFDSKTGDLYEYDEFLKVLVPLQKKEDSLGLRSWHSSLVGNKLRIRYKTQPTAYFRQKFPEDVTYYFRLRTEEIDLVKKESTLIVGKTHIEEKSLKSKGKCEYKKLYSKTINNLYVDYELIQ